MSKEYIEALKKERDLLKVKNRILQESLNKSDVGIADRLRRWVEYHNTPELFNEYPSLGFYIQEMRKVLNGQ